MSCKQSPGSSRSLANVVGAETIMSSSCQALVTAFIPASAGLCSSSSSSAATLLLASALPCDTALHSGSECRGLQVLHLHFGFLGGVKKKTKPTHNFKEASGGACAWLKPVFGQNLPSPPAIWGAAAAHSLVLTWNFRYIDIYSLLHKFCLL